MPTEKIVEAKPKAKPGNQKLQAFDAVEAKRNAIAMFSTDLNVYERGPDNKWRRAVRKD